MTSPPMSMSQSIPAGAKTQSMAALQRAMRIRIGKPWPYWALAIVVVIAFWQFISGERIIGYRDSIQTYWPLFEWIDSVWKRGVIPLWNPYDGLGRPVLAEGVSSVFYPGKLIFFLWPISFASRMGIYAAAHVWFAGCGAAVLARRLGANRAGAFASAICYAFGGPVLFQATNIIYLVGAAWLPWGLVSIWRGRANLLHSSSSILATGIIAAMMVLGGDPQMAYNLLLIGAIVWCWPKSIAEIISWQHRIAAVAADFARGILRVAIAGCISGMVAAVQILPCLESASSSDRSAYALPRTIWEWPDDEPNRGNGLWANWAQGVFGEPPPQTHHADIYEFSQPPWSLIELFWPNISGQPFPIFTHWPSAIPGAERVWQPSLYQSVICIFLAAIALWRRQKIRWVAIIGVLFALASFGWFGAVWLWNELGLASGLWKPLDGFGRPIGGLYWLMVTLLPGYVLFRYPAKLFIVATLCLAVLAGVALSDFGSRRSLMRLALLTALVSFAVLIVALISNCAARIPADFVDPWFGPIQAKLCAAQIQCALAHTTAISLLIALACRLRLNAPREWFSCSTLLLILVDIGVSNLWLLPGIDPLFEGPAMGFPRSAWPSVSELHIVDQAPRRWAEGSSEKRLEEVANWQLRARYPRLHLLHRERRLDSPSTIVDLELSWALAAYTNPTPTSPSPQTNAIFSITDLSGRRGPWVIYSPIMTSFEESQLGLGQFRNAGSREIDMRNSGSFPNNAKMSQQGRQTKFWDYFMGGVVECHRGVTSFGELAKNNSPFRQDRGKLILRSEGRVDTEVNMQDDGVFVLPEAYANGWEACIRDRTTGQEWDEPCVRVAGVFRGVYLPAGDYEVTFAYRPMAFTYGAAISIFAVVALFVYLAAPWSLKAKIPR